jgi:hypothetical protein
MISKRSLGFEAGGYRFGFTDWEGNFGAEFTTLQLGPLGAHYVPFSAAAGCALIATVLLLLIVAVAWAGMRRKRPAGTANT